MDSDKETPQKQKAKRVNNLPGAGPGRPKGVPNKTTKLLKEAIIMAAEEHGLDGKGEDGLKGYLRHVAAAAEAQTADVPAAKPATQA